MIKADEFRFQNVKDMLVEYESATLNNGPFASPHEGYAVIKEELDELWDEIKKKAIERDTEKMRREALQVAAMGLRFAIDCCGKD